MWYRTDLIFTAKVTDKLVLVGARIIDEIQIRILRSQMKCLITLLLCFHYLCDRFASRYLICNSLITEDSVVTTKENKDSYEQIVTDTHDYINRFVYAEIPLIQVLPLLILVYGL